MFLSINGKQYDSIHFVGILGSGMSSLAYYLCKYGIKITGSDRLLNANETLKIKSSLETVGSVLFTQDGTGITPQTSAICVSTAIENDNPDIKKATDLGIPIFHRSEILAAIVDTKKTIAIAGTSGKSTVTAMIFEFLTASGKAPSLISGAGLIRLEEQELLGNSFYSPSEWLIIEADESDGSLVKYKPHIALILNVSKDHKEISDVIELFKILAKQSHTTVINAEDELLIPIPHQISFGTSKNASWNPDSFQLEKDKCILHKDNIIYELPMIGMHNLHNLLAALSVCAEVQCDMKKVSDAVREFKGVARRFTITKAKNGVTVIDDFAHNPAKIEAALTSARIVAQKIVAIYQPHGFGPTRFLKNEYAQTFEKCLQANDHLFILPIYFAGGTAQKDITSQDLINLIPSANKRFQASAPLSRQELKDSLKSIVKQGDCILLMGARDPSLPFFYKEIISLFGEN